MYGLKEYRRSSKKTNSQGLQDLFKKYAGKDGLNRNQLKDAFQQLGALMPYKHAEEALKAADKNNDDVISGAEEYQSLAEYAINNGFGNSY